MGRPWAPPMRFRSLTAGVRPEGLRETHLPDEPQGLIMECPVKEPCSPKCRYPDMRRSNPTCEASGTTATIWKHQSGGGPAEDGRLNASERPLSRSVIGNRPKVLTGRRQKGTRGGSSAASTDDGDIKPRRTIGRSPPLLQIRQQGKPHPSRRKVEARPQGKVMAEGVEDAGKSEGSAVMAETGPREREYPTRKDFRRVSAER